MIGVLAARKAPELFGELVLVGLSPRYMDEGEYVGGAASGTSSRFAETLSPPLPYGPDGFSSDS